MSSPALDDARLRALSGSNLAIEIELIDMLLEEADVIMPTLIDCTARRDITAVGEAIHSLKGIAGNIGAIALRDEAAHLEDCVHDEVVAWADIENCLLTLGHAVNAVRGAKENRKGGAYERF